MYTQTPADISLNIHTSLMPVFVLLNTAVVGGDP